MGLTGSGLANQPAGRVSRTKRAHHYPVTTGQVSPRVWFYDEYFYPTWVVGMARNMWNWFGVDCRTNNYAEAHHSALGRKFGCKHPVLFRFLTVLKDYHVNVMRNVTGRLLGDAPPPKNPKYAQANQRLMHLQNEFDTRDPVTYLRAVAHSVPGPLIRGL